LVKALNAKSWTDVVKRGLRMSKPVYFAQVQLYMVYMQLGVALFTALNKDSQALHHEIVPFEPAEAQALSGRAVAIIRAADAEDLPPRMASAPDFYLCRMCAWSQRCWGEPRPGNAPGERFSGERAEPGHDLQSVIGTGPRHRRHQGLLLASPHRAARVQSLRLSERGLTAEGQCFPKTVDDLKPVLEIASEFPLHHLDIQPDIRPRRIEDCLPLLEGWMRLAEEVGFPVYFETHRDRMTTDLFFVLDLLDAIPDLPLLADLPHFLVGREFAWPVDDENHAMIDRILENSWAFHGRVASREQVQIEISFPPHRMWVELFEGWWQRGFESWRPRAAPDASLAFTCELGPKPYAIIGRDGNDTTDRWGESLQLRDISRDIWERGS